MTSSIESIVDTRTIDLDESIADKRTVDLDQVFIEIGDFGLFQVFIYALITVPVLLVSWFTFEFVFTAGNLDYR